MPKLEDFYRLSASRAELARLSNFNAIRLSGAERMANGKALRRDVPRYFPCGISARARTARSGFGP